MSNEEDREALVDLIDGCIPDDIPAYRQRYTDKAADAILAAGFHRTPVPAQGDYHEGLEEGIKIGRAEAVPTPQDTEWEYGISWLEGDERIYRAVDSAWGAAVEVRRINLGYPNPQENFATRRRPAGPWEEVKDAG